MHAAPEHARDLGEGCDRQILVAALDPLRVADADVECIGKILLCPISQASQFGDSSTHRAHDPGARFGLPPSWHPGTLPDGASPKHLLLSVDARLLVSYSFHMKPNTLKKTGRPRAGEQREGLVMVNFRADRDTLDAIAKLEAAFTGALPAFRKSAAIRRALQEAAAMLDGGK